MTGPDAQDEEIDKAIKEAMNATEDDIEICYSVKEHRELIDSRNVLKAKFEDAADKALAFACKYNDAVSECLALRSQLAIATQALEEIANGEITWPMTANKIASNALEEIRSAKD